MTQCDQLATPMYPVFYQKNAGWRKIPANLHNSDEPPGCAQVIRELLDGALQNVRQRLHALRVEGIGDGADAVFQ